MDIERKLFVAVAENNIIRVKLLIKLGASINNLLSWATNNGHKDVCKVLLEHGADVHAGNNRALRWAANNGHKDVCKVLLEHGADIDYAIKYAITKKSKNFLMQVKRELK